ncbi:MULTISPECIES: DUF1203 domain-containing protein [unclassified Streptomyces]|uniref:DUF1203 domain-containing protein n=1 Tax=unclassified Streptomyces TaxID=2593676 RepID=UPI000DAE3160|nr:MULTISPECIES: DUF1203 domain-containing protein [unclassified Streptomyces]PZT75802.1 DUF1203 domain-containing protein [Streptomyces sp. AC1-42W]PZT80243.1 DUF1203 domain-containing protein [Streptomyces sp. AC1-42T]
MTNVTFRPTAIAPHVLDRLRERDDAGAGVHSRVDDAGGAPLRCCLRRSRVGDRIALVSYAPLRRWAAETGAEPGAYDEVGPVFIHTDRCTGPDPAAGHPFTETGARRVLRRYSGDGHIAGGTLVQLPDDPDKAQAVMDAALYEAFADAAVALVHVRAVEYGCFQYEVRRLRP